MIRKWIEMTEMPESRLQRLDSKEDQDILMFSQVLVRV